MPVLLLLVLVLALMIVGVVLMPVSLVMRYRAGRSRRLARGWVASLNIGALGCSILLGLTGAAVMSYWTPGALTYALGGLAGGALLGTIGLALTRRERTSRGLHITPNALLVLLVTGLVAARLGYGAWRVWHAWRAGYDHTSWVVAEGVRGSIAAGAVVLGYYLTFWIGVWRWTRQP